MTARPWRVWATALIIGACSSDRMGPSPLPPATARLVVAGLPSPSVIGSFASVEVIAEDAAGRDTIASYRGTVRFTSTDPKATLPPDYTFVPTDSGRHAFAVIFETPGLYSVTATDVATSSITGADTVQVNAPPPPSVARLVVKGLPSPSVTGAIVHGEVIAEDAAGHDTIASYEGTVRFTSTDPAATLPPGYTFVPSDSGRHAFTVIFATPGLYSVTATDMATSSITGADTVQVTSAPPPTGLSKQIVFSSDRTGTYQLYAMDSTGANQRQIATTGAGAGAPDVSLDGMRVVFATSTQQDGNQIWVMNADGSGQTQLINPSQFDYTANPSWSPDGSKIAFGAHDWTNGYQVFVMSPTGTGLVRLAGGPYTASAPRWSPDGSKIVFISEESGPFDVWVMNSDGTNKIRLTSDGLDHLSADFSPDGRKILFTRRTYPRGGGAGSDIWVMNADGTNQTNVTRSPAGTRNPNARWASGGAKILFVTARDGNFEIYVMNADGSNPTNLTNNPAADLTPVWAK